MKIFLGLDCGGSSTRVLAVDAKGSVIYQGQSGAANLVTTPEARLRKNLAHATAGCPEVQYVCGCFAGLISEAQRVRALDILRGIFPTAQLRAEPDFTAALFAADSPTDICVIAGTGSLVCSHLNGKVVKSGGRGYILGDQGSGYRYGRSALLKFLDAPREASPGLRRLIQEVFESEDESTIVSAVYRSATPASLIAKLSRALVNDAKAGETYAIESIAANADELAQTVERHVQRYFPEQKTLRIGLAGGLWKGAQLVKDSFEEALKIRMPERVLNVERIHRPPLYGAVELAKEMSIGN